MYPFAVRIAPLIVMLLVIAGCAGAPERAPGAVDELERPPDDFTLDVAVLHGRRVPEQTRAELRNGHFILLADGSLLHDSGRSVDWTQRPGRVRWLYQQQVNELWRTARELGFTVASNADFSGNPALIVPDREQIVAIISFAAEGERWTFVRSTPAGEPFDPATTRLIRALADLAWGVDLPAERLLPIRFDFGPDPYAGFRRRGE